MRICETYPVVTLEDPADEDDTAGMQRAVAGVGASTFVVGDDYLVTSADRIRRAAAERAVDAVLIKVNQVGTVTGAADAIRAARENGLGVIVSARSGESEDTSVAHLATGWGADIVKVGSITRGERTAKWNELIRIDEELGGVELAPRHDPGDGGHSEPRESPAEASATRAARRRRIVSTMAHTRIPTALRGRGRR